MRPALRIPVVLAWTALTGASLGEAASSCSSATQGQGATDAAMGPEVVVLDGQPSLEVSLPDSPPPPAECEAVIDGAIVFFQDDAGTCPDGDTPIVV
jgi:hypothetical protein